ncbi:hypothetical protein D8B45_01185 [Candidatus Gracilibacteria bacterium]|nr:MAG: hypothetical protein D8B45_01185 [Candidatus Gracilibacteria bacterium]
MPNFWLALAKSEKIAILLLGRLPSTFRWIKKQERRLKIRFFCFLIYLEEECGGGFSQTFLFFRI